MTIDSCCSCINGQQAAAIVMKLMRACMVPCRESMLSQEVMTDDKVHRADMHDKHCQ